MSLLLSGTQSSEAKVDRGHLAVHGNGRQPGDVEHSDQLAEIVAELASVRKEIGRDVTEPFDVVAALPVGTDPAPYASAGATWWMVE
jgi:hypothetical protein